MILRRRSRWLLLPVRTRPSPGQTPVGECKKHKDVAERVGDISPPLVKSGDLRKVATAPASQTPPPHQAPTRAEGDPGSIGLEDSVYPGLR